MSTDSLPHGVSMLDELEVLVVVDNETDTLSSVDEGVPQIPEMAQHAARVPPSRSWEGHECKEVFSHLCCACHGYSALLTGRRGDETHRVLFDVGPMGDLWLDNARRLDVDLATIETVFLSHWHADHSGGFPVVLAAIARARKAAGRPPPVVDLHPARPDQRGVMLPNGEIMLLPEEPGFDDMAAAGAMIVTHDRPHALCGGFFFGSGEIARTTTYEQGLEGHYSFFGENGRADPMIMDERYVAACVRGRGATILSACSHAGIVNACLSLREHFAELPVDLVLGGYHLAGKAMEPRIEPTLRDLEERIEPRVVAPGHCTGWRAKARLAEAFAPGRYGPSVVGTLYRLSAS
ncbi:MAG: MBL fold metallo-hydrolase [Gammaproteobacteria bacterium]